MKLYDYWRSSASYRVRIGLRLEGMEYQAVSVNLAQGGQLSEAYQHHHPQQLVPALELNDGAILTQSLAILEWLEEVQPTPTLLPGSAQQRAEIRAFAQHIACDIHPIANLRVLKYLVQPTDTGGMGLTDADKLRWYNHWVQLGLQQAETRVKATSNGRFCFGEQPTLADVCLIPQLYNARRFDVPMQECPTLLSIEQHCLSLPAFAQAAPEVQGDAAI